MTFDRGLRPILDGVDTSWIVGGVMPFEAYSVGSHVPVLFERFARVLHPAWAAPGVPVRWDAIAAWSGRTSHPLAEFVPLSRPAGEVASAAPFQRKPDLGGLPPVILEPLCELLAAHTQTPDQCYVGVWEGYGGLDLASPALRLRLPQRTHLVFGGPIAEVGRIGRTLPDGSRVREPPGIIWPADRAWFVASEVDLDSTFVGGSGRLMDALLADPKLESWPAQPTDRVTWDSDLINGR
jgi:hypothetical protein